jgi:tetratricopeptide (TPR) repeat protein
MAKLQRLFLNITVGVFIGMGVCAQKDKQYFVEKAWKYFPQTSPEFRFMLDSAIQAYPNDAQLQREMATSYFKAGIYNQAIKYINQAVELDPKRLLSYRAFMKCIFLKDYSQAIADFHKALAYKNNLYEMDHTFYFYMGVSHLKLNHLDSASYYLKLSMENQLSSGKTDGHYVDWHYWGVIKFQQKKYTQALEYFNNALKQYSGFPDALYFKATIFLQKKKRTEAIALLKLAEQKLKAGYRLNEDNEAYVNYPFQITLGEVQELLTKANL